MKAVITNEGNSEQLTLKLVSEGANDRTLMSMLAKQYTAIRIQDRDSIEVPILSRDALVAASVDDLLIESDVEIVEGLRATIISLPWSGEFVNGDAKIYVDNPRYWNIVEFQVDGRSTDHEAFGLYPGSISKITVERIDHLNWKYEPGDRVQCVSSGSKNFGRFGIARNTENESILVHFDDDPQDRTLRVNRMDIRQAETMKDGRLRVRVRSTSRLDRRAVNRLADHVEASIPRV